MGSKNTKIQFNNHKDEMKQKRSLMKDIFGGVIRWERYQYGSKNVSVNFEPFFILQIEITRWEDLESCLDHFFSESRLIDYKVDDKNVAAA